MPIGPRASRTATGADVLAKSALYHGWSARETPRPGPANDDNESIRDPPGRDRLNDMLMHRPQLSKPSLKFNAAMLTNQA